MRKFEDYFVPTKNITFERYKFFSCDQKPGNTFDLYLAELYTLSKTCNFGDLRDSLIKDRIVCGIADNGLRERLLREKDLTLDKAIDLCRASQSSREQVKELAKTEMAVHAVKTKEQHKKRQGKHKKTKWWKAAVRNVEAATRREHVQLLGKRAIIVAKETNEEKSACIEFFVDVVQASHAGISC